jgi:hypothetical protein
MARDLNEAWGWIQKLISRVSRLESGAMLENSSITNGRMRFIGGLLRLDSGALLEVVGTFRLIGSLLMLTATGSVNLNGPVNISGTQTVTGILNVNGPWNLAGTGGITGNVSSTGNWTQTGNYTLTGAGKINVGTGMFLGPTSRGPGLEFDDGSTVSKRTYGTALAYTDSIYLAASSLAVGLKYGSVTLNLTALGVGIVGTTTISGSFSATSKSFKIPHPLKADTWLLHGVTESNEHGVEYRGDSVVGEDGSTAVELPYYFEALTVPGSTVYVTGRGFCADWTDVVGNEFTVMGEPGKRFSWLVKAARSDVTLTVEEPMDLSGQ